MRYWCQDESRFGLKTLTGRRITLKGVKPEGAVQWQRQAFYLYGVVEPLTGASFFWEFTHLDSDCFGVFLDQLAQAFPDSLNLLQLDNGSFHKAQQLEWPDNIIPIFQPPHSPQLNPYAFGGAKPYERLWQHLKRQFRWKNFESLDQLRQKLRELLDELALELVQALCGWEFIISALSRASL